MEALVRSESAYQTPFANSSLLPILLMSLMQQKHSPIIHNKPILDSYDYIIVGAGSAGSVVASRLSEVPCVSILLLEAGKPPPLLTEVPAFDASFWNSDVSWHYYTVPQKHTGNAMVKNQLYLTSGKTLGGGSTINVMLYVRGNMGDYNSWAENGAIGWSYSDVKPYFLKSENNTSPLFVADGYHTVDGLLTVSKNQCHSKLRNRIFEAANGLGLKVVDANAQRQTGIYDSQMTTRHGQRCSTAKAFLVPAENRTNLQIVPNAFVREILINNRKAVGVSFEHQGQVRSVRARREVILSAGTINSAHLLMLSGIGPKDELRKYNITVFADLPVGDNLQDHTGGVLYFELDPGVKLYNVGSGLKRPKNVREYVKSRKGPLASTDWVLPYLYQPNLSDPDGDIPNSQIYIQEGTAPSEDNTSGLKPSIIKEYFSQYANSTLFLCNVQSLRPKSRGTIRLYSTDPHDLPLIDPNFFGDPDDYTPLVAGLKLCNAMAQSEPFRKLGARMLKPFPGCENSFGDDDAYFLCLAKSFIFAYFHQAGSVKMGNPVDPTTVLDPRLKVKGIDGLRVVDASVMPTIISGNPNAPTIMIAEKAADMIKDTIDCYTQTPS